MPRPRALKPRLDQVEDRRTAAAGEADAAAGRRLLRAKTAIGEVVREALAVAGADVGAVGSLAVAADAHAALAAIPDTRALRDADLAAMPPLGTDQLRQADAFMAKITTMAKRFADGQPLDLAHASFAELFAWSLTQRWPEPPVRSPPPGCARATGARRQARG